MTSGWRPVSSHSITLDESWLTIAESSPSACLFTKGPQSLHIWLDIYGSF